MSESDTLVHRICEALYEARYPNASMGSGASYAECLVRDPALSRALREEVENVLSAIEALGLSVADLNLYTPKKRLRMSTAGPRMRTQGKLKQEVRNTPQRLTDQTRRRKRN